MPDTCGLFSDQDCGYEWPLLGTCPKGGFWPVADILFPITAVSSGRHKDIQKHSLTDQVVKDTMPMVLMRGARHHTRLGWIDALLTLSHRVCPFFGLRLSIALRGSPLM